MGGNSFRTLRKARRGLKPNVLSLRLSINASRLFRDYGIRYQNSRTHDGRKVSLWKETDGGVTNGVKGDNVLGVVLVSQTLSLSSHIDTD